MQFEKMDTLNPELLAGDLNIFNDYRWFVATIIMFVAKPLVKQHNLM